MADKLEQVAIRMVEQPPIYSNEPMNNPDVAIRVMNEFLSQMDRELFCIVNLQADLTPINMNIVSVGSLNEALINPREIFKSAILSNAHSMMLIHNHPSGNLTPSTSDIQTTARMQELGELMGISLVDHIITGRNGNYYSFRDKGEFPDSRVRFSTRVEDIDLTKGMVTEATAPYEEVTDTKEKGDVRDIPTVQTATIPLPVQGKDMDSIMQSLESGVEELFTSNRYQEFLKTMAKFHNYSFNNTMLIAMQRPDATLVTSYKNWQSMGRQVMKGEKGITIIAPAPYKKMKEKEVLDENQRPIMGTDGKPKTEQVEVTVPHFKAVTVFDIAQTSGEPIQTLAPELLTAAVQDFDSFMQAIQKISPVPIRFDEIDGNANGYYHNADKEIVIKKGLSESQTLKTAIHETVHAKLHDKEIMESLGVEKDRLTKEVEAESVAYCVCSSFGLDASDYSFPYIAGWSSSREMKEMKASMDVIRKTAGEMIDQLTEELEIILEEKQKTELHEKYGILVDALEAAGYRYDYRESEPGHIVLAPDGTHEIAGYLQFESWGDIKDWLEDTIAEGTDISERVDRALYPFKFDYTLEEEMFRGNGDRYAIYHVDEGTPGKQHLFMNMAMAKEDGITIDAANYKCVYSGRLHENEKMDDLYAVFNDNPPADYKAHSMSVSDVIITNRGGDMQAYYVDRFGFAELPEFAAQREKILDIVPEIENVDYENDLTCISFYAAECAEFPVMGEVHYDLTLPEALEAYEKIPSERMHGLKCVGFDLKDGSDYEGMQSLMIEGKIQKEFLNSIPGFRENSYVQNAISRVEKYLEERHPNVENPLESNKKVDNEKNISEEKNEKELNIQMKPIPKKKRGEMSL
ncbi:MULTISPECIES: JAB domain-containing protein [Blautia]|uniref:JAB domain-containing protein n=1 Tax=Blautia TaxID=572511 RepID=UPI001D0651DB|nr:MULTISPECIES: JAB domain-containing protein [Blautia]MCB6731234.1 ssDNA-binding domain-containing protein [Blautia obeum]MCB6742426.1 ssDNA-binding domain-containing protein [Blautia sp. 210820-DFI.6.14]MCB6958763.1 ssDNA-binding domain-containing protein [Blautia obeum]MCG4675834.1 YodL domain-containing protein [Blautia obeum]MDE8681701.1 JAB domain-containing protein [Blautia schinkii]